MNPGIILNKLESAIPEQCRACTTALNKCSSLLLKVIQDGLDVDTAHTTVSTDLQDNCPSGSFKRATGWTQVSTGCNYEE